MKIRLNRRQYDLVSEVVKKEIEEQGDVNSEPSAGTSQTQSGGAGYPQVGKWESGVTRGPSNQIGVTKWSDVVGSSLKRGKSNQLKESIISEQTYKGVQRPSELVPAKELVPNATAQDKTTGKIYNPYLVKKKVPGTTVDSDEFLYWGYVSPIYGTVIDTKDRLIPKYEKEVDNWLRSNLGITLADELRYKNRKSKSGKDVPYGFNPDSYDEYLRKKSFIDAQVKNIPKDTRNLSDSDRKKLNIANIQLRDLKNEYYSLEFSYGIRPEELELYKNGLNDIKKEYDTQINDLINLKIKEQSRSRAVGIDNTYQTNPIIDPKIARELNLQITKRNETYDDKINQLYQEKDKKIKALNLMFGKDDWYKDVGIFGENFDRFWDKWGWALATGINMGLIAFSGGIALGLRSLVGGVSRIIGLQVTTSGAIRAIAPYAADAAFNAAVSAYELGRNQKGNAVISAMCAIVPFISYGKNIGKISVTEAQDLVNKINKLDLKNTSQLHAFVNSLNDRQRYIFRNASSLSKESIKKNMDEIIRKAKTGIEQTNIKIPPAKLKTWMAPILKQISIEAGPPLLTAVVNAYLNLFKEINPNYTEKDLTTLRIDIKNALLNATVFQSLVTVVTVVENPENIQNEEEFVNIINKRLKEPKEISDETLTKLAGIFKIPPDSLKKKDEFMNKKLKDLISN
jgi:hypothetical protein